LEEHAHELEEKEINEEKKEQELEKHAH